MELDILNYNAVSFLEGLGNVSPTQQQIDFMEIMLSRISNKYQVKTFKEIELI